MKYGAQLAAVGINVPASMIYSAIVLNSWGKVGASMILAALAIAAIATWPRGRPKSKYAIYTFLAVIGSLALWVGVLSLSEFLPLFPATIAHHLAAAVSYAGIGLVLVSMVMSYFAIRKDQRLEREGR